MYDGLDREQFLGTLLGALVEQQGGIVHIDKTAFDHFRKGVFYAVKLDFEGEKIILEVLDEDPATKSASEDPNKS
jgi:hypothetical protein